MRSFRNFMYNYSDIFVALIIIALAAFLIWTRVDVIMDYPNTIAAEKSTQTSADVDPQYMTTDDETNELDPNLEYREITIPEGSSIDVVAGILKQGGLVVNVDDFTYQVQNMGLDEKVLPGVYNIPLGISMEEMVNILCGISSTPTADSETSGNEASSSTEASAGAEDSTEQTQ